MSDGAHRDGVSTGFVLGAALLMVVVAGASSVATMSVGATTDSSGTMVTASDRTVTEPTPVGSPPEPVVSSAAPVSGYDRIRVRIDLAQNGSVYWIVAYRYELDDGPARKAFERASENVTGGPPGSFITALQEGPVADAERTTGRSMRLENGIAVAENDPSSPLGVVRYRFRWKNFAKRTGDGEVVLGDAIAGYTLGTNQTLVVEWADRYSRASVSPEPSAAQENVVRWSGTDDIVFRTEDPRVVLEDTRESGGTGILMIAGVAGLLIAVFGAWYGRSRWLDGRTSTGTEETATTAGPTTSGTSTDEPTTEDAGAEEAPPEELLSDEEHVMKLLEERGGRIKQQTVIEEMDWSRTKTSDVVNEMHEDERIELYRLGRENVLALPGEIEI